MRKLMLMLSAVVLTSSLAYADEAKAPAAAPAKAAPKKAHKKMSRMMGTVDAVDAAANSVSLKDAKGAVSKLAVTADTKIKRNGKMAAIADLVAGDRITVTCEGEGDAMKCVSIMAKAPTAAKKK